MGRRTRFGIVATLLFGMLVVAAPGAQSHSAGSHYTKRWGRQKEVSYAFTPSVPAAFRARTEQAASQWNAVGQPMTFKRAADFSTNYNPYSGCQSYQRNGIHRRSIDGGGGTVAQTVSCVFSGTREMYSFQVVYDSGENWFTGGSGSPGSKVDLASIAAHEMGHGTGFTGHFSSAYCGNGSSQQTMCARHYLGTIHQRDLGLHDRHTFAAAY